jgi:ferredoxin
VKFDEHPTVKRYREIARQGFSQKPEEKLDSEWLKKLALDSGADDVGLVDIDRSGMEIHRKDILEVFPPTETLMSLVRRLNPENIRCVSRAVSDLEFLHGMRKVDAVASKIVEDLGKKGVRVLNPPSGFPMEMAKWPGKMWPVPHKVVAVEAGLGAMGHHRLLIHPRFGNFVTLGTILIDRVATAYDRPLNFNPCLQCKLCVSVCPVGAIGPDGHFSFVNCMTHNYRDRMGGFLDWVKSMVSSKDFRSYRSKFKDSETVSMWQTLSYGICNKSSYCMAVCPAGEEMIGPFLDNRKTFLETVVGSLQDKVESIYVVPGSDGEAHVAKHFPHKNIRRIGHGLRASSVKSFFDALPLLFQRNQSEGLNATYCFTFTGAEAFKKTVVIRDKKIEIQDGHIKTPDLHLLADSKTWLNFLAKEENLFWAMLRRKIRIRGSPRLMKSFARCFPS